MITKKKIILLSVCAVVLIGILILVNTMQFSEGKPKQIDSDVQSDAAPEEKGTIFQCSVDSISSIELSSAEESYTIIKHANTWTSVQNPNASFSASAISVLTLELSSVQYCDILDISKVSAADCGLEQPAASLTCQMGEEKITFYRGNVAADKNYCYLKTDRNDTIYMIKLEKAEAMFVSLQSLRADSIQRISFDSVTEIDIQNADASMHLKKGKASAADAVFYSWKMTAPVSVYAKDQEIDEKIIQPLKNMSVQFFADDSGELAKYGLASKDKYIALTDASGKKETIYFGTIEDSTCYISIDSDVNVYAIDIASAAPLAVLPMDVADKYINLKNRDKIDKVDISSTGGSFSIDFSMEKNQNKVNGHTVKDDSFVANVFEGVCGLLADDICTEKAGTAVITITFTYTDHTADKIEFANYNDRNYAVTKNGTTMYLILKKKLDALFTALQQYK